MQFYQPKASPRSNAPKRKPSEPKPKTERTKARSPHSSSGAASTYHRRNVLSVPLKPNQATLSSQEPRPHMSLRKYSHQRPAKTSPTSNSKTKVKNPAARLAH